MYFLLLINVGLGFIYIKKINISNYDLKMEKHNMPKYKILKLYSQS